LRWWWQSVWGATMAGLGFRRSAVFGRGRAVGYRWARPGPPPDLSKVQRPTWLPPDGELGVAVGARVVLVSEERFAIALVDCVAYSSGFEFTISYRSRDDLGREVLGFGLPPVPGRELEVRIEYPDGHHASSGTEAMSAHYEASYQGREPPSPSGLDRAASAWRRRRQPLRADVLVLANSDRRAHTDCGPVARGRYRIHVG